MATGGSTPPQGNTPKKMILTREDYDPSIPEEDFERVLEEDRRRGELLSDFHRRDARIRQLFREQRRNPRSLQQALAQVHAIASSSEDSSSASSQAFNMQGLMAAFPQPAPDSFDTERATIRHWIDKMRGLMNELPREWMHSIHRTGMPLDIIPHLQIKTNNMLARASEIHNLAHRTRRLCDASDQPVAHTNVVDMRILFDEIRGEFIDSRGFATPNIDWICEYGSQACRVAVANPQFPVGMCARLCKKLLPGISALRNHIMDLQKFLEENGANPPPRVGPVKKLF